MAWFTHLQPDVVAKKTNTEAAPCAFHDLSSETARNDALKDVQISAWEAVLHEEHAPTPTREATAVHDEVTVEFESRHIENLRPNEKT